MRLWSLSQKRPIHNPQCSFLLEGSLNIELFEQAIVQVMQRHEILHTLFYQAPGMEIPVQVVSENVKVSYQIISLMHLDEAAKAVQLDEHFARLQELSYDLEQGPLWRVWLLRLTPQRHVVLLGCSGLCADAASLPLLLQAWRQAYSGVPWQEEEPLQYADVAQWRLELAEDAQLQEGRHYWQALPLEEFARQPLPYQRSGSWSPASPDGQEERREHYYELELDLEQARVLEQCSQQQQVWRETVLLAGWLALWWRLTQQDQLRLGVQADGRPYEELGGVLGPCSELLPLQIELVAGLSWQHLLQRVQRVLQEGREHQLAFAGTPGEQQALAVSFRYLNWPQQSWAPGVHSRLLRLSNWPEAVALSLLVLDLGETVRLHLRSGRLAGSDLARL
ncbi:MAG TPA: condensation domain-containing protein, partial [Ktedonosporobacter sp.]|nr:condensation domain-containing protein [Ktedonosporobacter sp.]